MITDPGGIATAAAQAERAPRAKVTVDWDNDGVAGVDDVSSQIGAVKISRQITGDLPNEVAQVEGSSVAEATVELAVGDLTDNAKHAAWYFSRPNSASPLAGKERLSRLVTVDLGFDTAPGVTAYVRRFTGLSRALPVSSTSRVATLTALDNRERLRTKVALPALAADVGPGSPKKPGLNAQWLVDYVLRRNGFNASPQRVSNTGNTTVAAATMHGSAEPETGTLFEAGLWDETGPPVFVQGRFGYAMGKPDVSGGTPVQWNYARYFATQDLGRPGVVWEYLFAEWWGQFDTTVTVTQTVFIAGSMHVELVYSAGVHSLRVTIGYDASAVAQTATATLNTSAVYFAFSIQHRGASGLRVLITQDAVTTTTNFAAGTVVDDPVVSDDVFVQAMGLVEGLNVVVGNPGVDAVPVSAWGYVAGAELGASANELVAALPSDARDSWGLIQEIAQAEFAWVGFTEAGVPFYRTPAYWAATAQQTVSHTIHADRDLLELAYDDNIDHIRNQITVPVNALTITPLQDVWTADVLHLGGRTTTSFLVTFDNPLVDLDTSVQPVIGGLPVAGASRVKANTRSDGTGLDRSSYISVTIDFWTAGTAKVTVTSRYSGQLWIVDTTGAAALTLAGRQVVVNESTATAAFEEDAASITLFGPQPLDLPANPWRQDLSAARGVAQGMLGRLARPQVTYTGVRVLGDPRRQLGDRARLVDPDGLAADVEVWLTGCDDELSPDGGYTQGLSARQASTIAVWNTSSWDDGTVWGI